MKRIYTILALLFLFIHYTNSQVYTEQHADRNFILDSSIVTVDNVSFTARDEIDLTEGLYAYTTVGNILFDIDQTLIFPILSSEYVDPGDVESRTRDASLDFGSVPGSFSVGSNGTANYTIPIFTSPGTRSLTPSLKLQYSSNGMDGMLGTGWNLSGGSTIHRLPKTMHHDSTVDGINLNQTDILALDGNRLVLTSGTYGTAGSTYETKFESFMEIEAYGIAGNGPLYFTVSANNGYTFEYGQTADSKVGLDGTNTILAWKLNKVIDPNGNYILYEYDNSQSGQAYLTNILYTGNDNTSLDPYNEIRILYQEREDSNRFYLKGHAIENTYLVRKIQSFGSGEQLREYVFNYSYRNGTYLSEIIEFNQVGERHNATTIGWNNYADTIVKSTLPEFFFSENARFGDFNYDGFSDYITVEEKTGGFTAKLYLNQGDGDFCSTIQDSVEYDEAYVDHFIGDFNADGKS
ncbi:MAG: hypothetical protein K9G38_07595, partial [Bacteroidales bacterium]|nr:hypothetical protein [Bacteroidales bacterium]